MRRLVRHRPSPAMGVALLALFVSLGGVSYGVATGSIDGREIKNSTITAKDVRNSSLTGSDVRNSSLTGSDLRNDSLTGSDVAESRLGTVPRATDAGTLDGVDSAAFLRSSAVAGGALAGTFPNPALAAGAVTASKLGKLTERASAVTSIPAGQSRLLIATCAVGERVISGGGVWEAPADADDLQIVHSFPSVSQVATTADDWRVRMRNGTGAAENAFAQVICLAG